MYFEWKDLTINNSIEYACKSWGEREALVYGDQRITYQQLQREVFELTNALKSLGITKGTRVAYLLSDIPEWVYFFYAILNIGAIVVPLNLTWVGREIEQGLILTDADILVTIDEFRGKDFISILKKQFPELQDAKKDKLKIEKLPLLKKIITLSKAGRKYDFSYDSHEVKDSGSDYDAQEILSMSNEVKPDDVCAYMLTSGSTGFPKPVIHTQNTMLFAVANMADCHDIRTTDKLLHFAPTYHVAGTGIFLLSHLRGSAMHQADYFEPEWAMRIIEKEKITVMWGFDVHYLMMIRHPRYGVYDLKSLDRVLIGNSPGTYDEIKTMGIPHHGNIYGTSEDSGCQSHFPYRDRFDEYRKKYSNGRPLSFNEIKIVDPETGVELGPNEMGEICSKGPGLFKGFYNMPKETAEAMDEDGFYHTGDYGWLDEKGYVYYRGRIKDTVKTGGENVSAREVEIVLEAETPWVNTAIVFGVPDPKWGEAVVAMVELKPESSVEEDELKTFCKDIMAGYKIPKKFIFVKAEEWIVTPTGKFDKKALRERTMKQLGIEEAT
jgi:fatty-acyl-CoA synthase